ncbi:MAG: sugar ABC transporter substrate-binding protein, partial [Alphaproteobacteria bacterium]|nr:sugar ABC transporter substrate-binding protein [Alphaproteobacteria bacterium]
MTADIVVVMKNRLNPAYGGALVGARKAAARFGLTLADTAPALADDVEEQRALMAETIAARPKAIVLLPAHESRLNDAVGAAHAAGIPVFVIVSKPTAAEWITHVGSEHVGMAHDLAAYLFDRLGDAGNIVVMDGHPDSIATPERHEGFIRAAHERPGMTILESVCGWFLREPAREATRAVLQRHARIDGMLVANDLMAMGVLEALAETGRRLPV